MVKFVSRIGGLTFLGFAFFCVLNICAALTWGIFGWLIPFIVITAFNVLVVFPYFFGTYYYMGPDYIQINNFWFFKRKIKYSDIVVAVPCTQTKLASALCSDGIKIVYMKNDKTKEAFISPAMFELFLNQLTDNIMYDTVLEEKISNKSSKEQQLQADSEQKLAENGAW